jgi:hypothetical protein
MNSKKTDRDVLDTALIDAAIESLLTDKNLRVTFVASCKQMGISMTDSSERRGRINEKSIELEALPRPRRRAALWALLQKLS